MPPRAVSALSLEVAIAAVEDGRLAVRVALTPPHACVHVDASVHGEVGGVEDVAV